MSCIAGLTEDGHFYLNNLLDNSYNSQKINNVQVFLHYLDYNFYLDIHSSKKAYRSSITCKNNLLKQQTFRKHIKVYINYVVKQTIIYSATHNFLPSPTAFFFLHSLRARSVTYMHSHSVMILMEIRIKFIATEYIFHLNLNI